MGDGSATFLLVSPDLMAQTRVVDTLAHAGYRVRVAESLPSPEDLAGVGAVLLDLNTPGWPEAAAASVNAGRPLLAFGQHVDGERLRQAREAGCDPVVPRSRFFTEMAALAQMLAGSRRPEA